MKDILSGEEKPSKMVVKRIAAYFSIPCAMLICDEEELPPFNSLKIDMNLVAIQKDDLDAQMEREKHRHFFANNWRVLGYKKRFNLVLTTLLIAVPMFIFIFYCMFLVIDEKNTKLSEYKAESLDEAIYDTTSSQQVAYYNELLETSKEKKEDAYYVDVKVGTVLEKIKNIDPASSSYEVRMQLYFIFDKDEFKNMFVNYARNFLAEQIIDEYYSVTGEFREDNIEYNEWLDFHAEFFNEWVEANDSRYYPGETPTNVLVEKETMFDIGNGEFVADSYGTINNLEEIQYYDEEGRLRTTCYQKVKFNATFEKAFDSVRYPLESIQFNMFILPIMDAQYIRYYPDESLTSDGDRVSGFTPFFGIGGGYRLLKERDGVKNFSTKICYYKDENNDPAVPFEHTIRTQYQITVRANRSGISLFLKAFINLFSVVIWIIIAFYNQSYTGEDSIGLLGTGLFGVISSMLVGLNMVSDAGIFSIITMINIFTLAVIMIMTYQSIAAKRANARCDKVLIAYNGIKLRILFYVLTVATVIMFILVPLLSYMWGF